MNTSAKPPRGYIEVARQDEAVLMRIVGLGNMNISLTLSEFCKSSLQKGFTHFALDLGPCTGMDSTFMGTIISMSTMVQAENGWICLVNVSDANRRLLEMIGVWGLVSVSEQFDLVDVETECLVPDENPIQRLQHIRNAHERLVEIDARNKERFGLFLKTLQNEMEDKDLDD